MPFLHYPFPAKTIDIQHVYEYTSLKREQALHDYHLMPSLVEDALEFMEKKPGNVVQLSARDSTKLNTDR